MTSSPHAIIPKYSLIDRYCFYAKYYKGLKYDIIGILACQRLDFKGLKDFNPRDFVKAIYKLFKDSKFATMFFQPQCIFEKYMNIAEIKEQIERK